MSQDRPYRCPVCRRGFRSHPCLKGHMEEHAPSRQCRNCGKPLRENEYHRNRLGDHPARWHGNDISVRAGTKV